MTPSEQPQVVPVFASDLASVCQFYHEHLNPQIPVADWISAFSRHRCQNQPNHGFMLVDGEKIVGAFGAIYSDQWIEGRMERFCNHTSWVVCREYRKWSRELLLALLRQEDFHVTSYTTNPHVANLCRQRHFSQLDDRVEVFFNRPRFFSARYVSQDSAVIQAVLDPHVYRDYENHRQLPGLEFMVLGASGRGALVVYKKKIWKKLPCAIILHCSDWEVFLHFSKDLGACLLWWHGLVAMQVHAYRLPPAVTGTLSIRDTQPRLFISRGVKPSHLSFLYSELTALNLAM
ncbi:MAG: hypothetical protein HW380_115 [Magnetococcales bacterium]|nr:hypothetical protein [Magnetococcales bacterium]HIJ85673.1 hypothetical protein [Magnetococcales bacterium]